MRRVAVAVTAMVLVLVVAGCASTAESPRNKAAAEANTKLGIKLLRRDEPQRAMQKLNEAVTQDPNNATAYMVRGLVYERLAKPDKAEASYQEALSLSNDNPRVLNNYGSFLCQRGDIDRALALFERSADIPTYETPEVPLANAGVCALRNGRRPQAKQYLQESLRENKELPTALLRMAQIRFKDEQYMSARGYYQRYLDVAGQTPTSAWLGVRIETELGNKDAVASYKQLLRNKFPDSEQTEKLLEWESDGRL